jgi:hypothetical protein
MMYQKDAKLIQKYIHRCARSRMTLERMASAVGRTKGWASLIVNGKITRLQFGTRNRIREFLGEL